MSLQSVQKKDWVKKLVEELRRLIETLEYDTIRIKHAVGTRILPLYKEGKIKRGTIKKLANGIGWSRREINRCVKFARKYATPTDAIRELGPMGLTLTWHNVHTFLLPDKQETPPLPKEPFNIFYADPPWRYEFSKSERGDPEEHYPTMSVEEICELKLKLPTADTAVLFLWATAPKLQEALEVIQSWGFEYRTHMIWVKDKWGTGHYIRGQHELLLIGRKGDVWVPEEGDRPSSVFRAKRTEHSKKPGRVYEIIEKMYPGQKYLELFARNEREGWTPWGLDIGS